MVEQKELGGKHLLLKRAGALTFATTDESTDISFTANHNLKVGDIWKPTSVGGNTTLVANKIYYVKEIVDSDTIRVSLTPTGQAVEADATAATQASLGFYSIGGIRSKSFSLNSDAIDITNEDSDEWRNILDEAGVRSASISGSGVYTNTENTQALEDDFLNNRLVELCFIEVKANRVWNAYFKLTSVEISGDYNAESGFSVAAESSGKVNIVTMV